MSTIVTRNGKGTALTWTELDDNFTNLNNDKYESGDDPTFGTVTATTYVGLPAGGSAAGNNTEVQFNDSGSMAGDPSFTWDKTGNVLTLSNVPVYSYRSGAGGTYLIGLGAQPVQWDSTGEIYGFQLGTKAFLTTRQSGAQTQLSHGMRMDSAGNPVYTTTGLTPVWIDLSGGQVLFSGAASGTAGGTITPTYSMLIDHDTNYVIVYGDFYVRGASIPQNSQSAAYTLVAEDANKHILHPSADTTARTFTIPANSSVPFEIGTAITFVNQNSAGVITISITTDTMRLAGAGTTGSRTLAANGVATALKITSTEWIISGTGLT